MAENAKSKTQGKSTKRKKPLFLKQPQMRRVVYALVPILFSAIYFFGWRSLSVVAVVFAAGLATEFITSRSQGRPISQACFVTCMLFGLSLPPTVPYYVAVVGVVVAILFGKEVFGGFGRNFANPAIVGRAFVYVCFPTQLTGQFVPAFRGLPGGFGHWSFLSAYRDGLPDYLASAGTQAVDAVTQASPMWVYRDVSQQIGENGYTWWNMLLGNIGGIFTQDGQSRILAAGSMGEGCAVLILLAAAYLLITKTANYRLMFGAVLGAAIANLLFRNVLGFAGQGGVPPLLFNLLAGTTLYAMVFMVTDPVSATKKKPAQWAYAIIIGFAMVFMRWRGVFVAAASFAILFGNIVGPLLDLAAGAWEDRKKAKQVAAGEKGASSA
jgi:Na+-transporting NADH:ubiquinone oxidoreductase subunit B